MTKILPILVLLPLIVPLASASLSVDPTVQLSPGDNTMTVYLDTAIVIDVIRVGGSNISINAVSLSVASSSDVNATVRDWAPSSLQGRNRNFVLDVNTTTGNTIMFMLEITNTALFFIDWVATVDGIEAGVGGANQPVRFSLSDWTTGVDRQVRITADIGRIFTVTDPRSLWLIQYGPAWAALIVAIAIFAVIITSFYVGIKRRRRSGKVWKYMSKKWK